MHCFSAVVDVNNSLCKVERTLDRINNPICGKQKGKKLTSLFKCYSHTFTLHPGENAKGCRSKDSRISINFQY